MISRVFFGESEPVVKTPPCEGGTAERMSVEGRFDKQSAVLVVSVSHARLRAVHKKKACRAGKLAKTRLAIYIKPWQACSNSPTSCSTRGQPEKRWPGKRSKTASPQETQAGPGFFSDARCLFAARLLSSMWSCVLTAGIQLIRSLDEQGVTKDDSIASTRV